MLETKLQKLDPQRLLETNLFVAALRRNTPGDAGFFIYERDSHPYDGLYLICTRFLDISLFLKFCRELAMLIFLQAAQHWGDSNV